MLEAQELECERGPRKLFSGLSFALRAGGALRVAGANGSGKTSLLRILCGLSPPAQGRVSWNGTDIGELGEEYSTRLVYLGHAPAVKDDLTAAENLAIACRIAGQPALPEAIGNALERFGLAGREIPARRLSQGQRRRAALARLALSAGRPLWLLDEPFAALDTAGIELLRDLIAAHRTRGGAAVYTTHQDAGITGAAVIELG